MRYYNYLYKIVFRKEESCFTRCLGYLIFSAIFEFGGSFCILIMVIELADESDEANIGSCPTKKSIIIKLKNIK